MKTITDKFVLENGVEIPCVGFGTWQTPNDEVGYKAVIKALEVGYRHIDTATVYKNESTVGQAIKDSGVPREDIFLTTKLWNGIRGYEETIQAFNESLERLQVEYVDLYLIHWPNPEKYRDNWQEMNAETWRAMETLYENGKIRAIGVSNFRVHHLEALRKSAHIMPMVNQIKLCPGNVNQEVVDYCTKNNILLQGYSPLGTGGIFDVPVMKNIAEKYNTDVAKVALKWSIQRGFLPLPKSVTPKRIEDNADFLDLIISDEDMAIINALDGVCGIEKDPDTVPF